MAQLDQILAVIAAAEMGRAGPDHGIGEGLARADAQAAVVQEGAAASLGGVELVRRRVEDDRADDLALALERDGDGEMRNAVQEIGGAVERIDDPGMAPSVPLISSPRSPRKP